MDSPLADGDSLEYSKSFTQDALEEAAAAAAAAVSAATAVEHVTTTSHNETDGNVSRGSIDQPTPGEPLQAASPSPFKTLAAIEARESGQHETASGANDTAASRSVTFGAKNPGSADRDAPGGLKDGTLTGSADGVAPRSPSPGDSAPAHGQPSQGDLDPIAVLAKAAATVDKNPDNEQGGDTQVEPGAVLVKSMLQGATKQVQGEQQSLGLTQAAATLAREEGGEVFQALEENVLGRSKASPGRMFARDKPNPLEMGSVPTGEADDPTQAPKAVGRSAAPTAGSSNAAGVESNVHHKGEAATSSCDEPRAPPGSSSAERTVEGARPQPGSENKGGIRQGQVSEPAVGGQEGQANDQPREPATEPKLLDQKLFTEAVARNRNRGIQCVDPVATDPDQEWRPPARPKSRFKRSVHPLHRSDPSFTRPHGETTRAARLVESVCDGHPRRRIRKRVHEVSAKTEPVFEPVHLSETMRTMLSSTKKMTWVKGKTQKTSSPRQPMGARQGGTSRSGARSVHRRGKDDYDDDDFEDESPGHEYEDDFDAAVPQAVPPSRIDELARPVHKGKPSKRPLTATTEKGKRMEANLRYLARFDDVKECTFQPRVTKGYDFGTGEGKDEEEKDDLGFQFLRRQDAWANKIRRDQEHTRGKVAYEALLTRKICPNCRLADGSLVYQAYDEFLEKRNVCTVCSAKYVRQSSWAEVKEEFLRQEAEFKERKAKNLEELRQKYWGEVCDTRKSMKSVYDAEKDETVERPLFARYRDEAERDEIWDRFITRAEEDWVRRRDDFKEWDEQRRSNAQALDPECTFQPVLSDIENNPLLEDVMDRLAQTTVIERMEEDLQKRRAHQAEMDDLAPAKDKLPTYLRIKRGWLPEERRPRDTVDEKGLLDQDEKLGRVPSAVRKWEPKLLTRAEAKSACRIGTQDDKAQFK